MAGQRSVCWHLYNNQERHEFGDGLNGLVRLTTCRNCSKTDFGTSGILTSDTSRIQDWADAARQMLKVLEEKGIVS